MGIASPAALLKAMICLVSLAWFCPARACGNDYGRNQRVEFNFAQATVNVDNGLAMGTVIAGGNTPLKTLWRLRNCKGRQLSRTLTHATAAGYPHTYRIPGIHGIGFRVYGAYRPTTQPLPASTRIQFAVTSSGEVIWRMELIKIGALNSTSVTIPAGKYASMDLSGFGNIAQFFLPRGITIVAAAKPCAVSSAGNLAIDLGRIGASQLQAGGATGDWKNGQAKLVVTSCPPGTQTLTVRFSGEADARDGTLFKNAGGTARNVAIRFGHAGVRAVSPGGTSSVAIQNGRAEMPLTAQFVSTGAATAGTVWGRVTATMTYQ